MKPSSVCIFLAISLCNAFQPNQNRSPQRKISFELYKKKFTINTNLVGDVSSDGLLADQKKAKRKEQDARTAVKSTLGVKSKTKKKKLSKNPTETKKLSKKAEKIAKQRTMNGTVDSTLQAGLSLPEDQDVQIQSIKRGSKSLTIIRGLTCSMDERKKMLKEMKSKLGGGGTLVEGVLELQGSHVDKILDLMKKKGFLKAKILK